jgi:RNA polymerase sigma-70 factor (ECF subfamily)
MPIPGIFLALQLSAEHDDNLALRLQRRDPEAMGDLYDRFGRLTYSVILAIVRDAALAEDLLQETFLRVWNQAHAFEPGRGALGPWLLAMARDRAIDRVRALDPDERERHSALVEPGLFVGPAMFVDMDKKVLNTDHPRVIRSAIAKLSADQRKVIELAYYEGLSQRGMAERMGEPLGAVKIWVREAVKHLREALGQAKAA